MVEAEDSYAVAITFPGNIAGVFSQLREKYNQYVDYKIEPHITLVYPFIPIVDIVVVSEKLAEVSQMTKPFTLVFDGIRYFEGEVNAAYAAVANRLPLADLYTGINNALRGLIKVEDIFERFDREDFVPHMTISDQIPDEAFPVIKKELAEYGMSRECEITEFVLFSAGNDGIWQREKVFKLNGGV